MARTTPRTWGDLQADLASNGPPRIYAEYVSALADEDVSGDVEDATYHQGRREAYEHVLDMLHTPAPVRLEGIAGSPFLGGHGIIEVGPGVVLYEKCQHCHLFIDVNHAALDEDGQPIPGVLLFIHLHRGDGPDEALDESHDAEPSGRLATLLTWKTYGPEAMRERFTD